MNDALHLPQRPRRNRVSAAIRSMARETILHPGDFIQPVFVHDGTTDEPVDSMPGQQRWSLDGLVTFARTLADAGVSGIDLFGRIPSHLKTPMGEEATNPDGLIPQAIAAVKAAVPELAVMTDVALDPYTTTGQDGLVIGGEVVNDPTVAVLVQQALTHARAGADLIGPSDMMDGRVGEIRSALDAEGFTNVGIMSYTAKYASAYYGPFRGALDSAPAGGMGKETYQMDPANSREALRELDLDVAEGADMVMVKPAGPCLDIIARLADYSPVPVTAYQVSGEYLMIEAAAQSGWIDRDAVMMESLLGIKRAGASAILTYYALDAARRLQG
ncbi:porphobilinogen synthase [Stomatohabitans albus]|uniref:porphobilinogen synthase n=1 Tax=Stomatohabitans albus TaxID=3110766 RepID=UPI00300D681D